MLPARGRAEKRAGNGRDGGRAPAVISSWPAPSQQPTAQHVSSSRPGAGFAVADVNYGGSTGYGRAYRKRCARCCSCCPLRPACDSPPDAPHLTRPLTAPLPCPAMPCRAAGWRASGAWWMSTTAALPPATWRSKGWPTLLASASPAGRRAGTPPWQRCPSGGAGGQAAGGERPHQPANDSPVLAVAAWLRAQGCEPAAVHGRQRSRASCRRRCCQTGQSQGRVQRGRLPLWCGRPGAAGKGWLVGWRMGQVTGWLVG